MLNRLVETIKMDGLILIKVRTYQSIMNSNKTAEKETNYRRQENMKDEP